MNESKYGKYLIEKPMYELGVGLDVKGRQVPTMTFLNNTLLPNSNNYVEFSWIYEVTDPNPLVGEHAHDDDQIVLHIGSDPKNPEDLGAEVEIIIEGERFVTKKTHVMFLPKDIKHGPITWLKVDRPLLEMTIVLGAGTVEAAKPAGMTK